MIKIGRSDVVAAGALAVIDGTAPSAGPVSADISGTVCMRGAWAKYGNIRTKSGAGDIRHDLTSNTSTATAIRLHNASNGDAMFTDPRVLATAPQSQNVGTNVLNQTRFKIGARMYADRGGDNLWAGRLSW